MMGNEFVHIINAVIADYNIILLKTVFSVGKWLTSL